MKKSDLSSIMALAWQFVKRNGFSMSEALKVAWQNFKVRKAMLAGIARFTFRKIDGTIREAYGTLRSNLMPQTNGSRKANDTVQTYFDTERQEFRCFKKANLLTI